MNKEDIIKEIREKIRNNPKYVHPCCKEFQEDIKKYGFKSGCEFSYFLEGIGILRHAYIDDLLKRRGCKTVKEYKNKIVKDRGYKDINEYNRNWGYGKGISSPRSENKDCTLYFGIDIAEKYVSATFGDVIRMPINYPGYDWICKNKKRIQCKAVCLCVIRGDRGVSVGYNFEVDYNSNTDYFIFIGWDNRYDLNPLHVWLIHKDEIIRWRKLWRRVSLWINNNHKGLLEFKKYEVTDKLEKLKEICNNRK